MRKGKMNLMIFRWVCVLLVLLPSWCCGNVVSAPILTMQMSNEGFHRELLYDVHFDDPWEGKQCKYVLEQQFPAAVYVSVDQLNDLKRLGKLHALYPEYVDIEASTEHATPFTVLLTGSPMHTADTIKLPIHFRYHQASDDSTPALVDIVPPLMYLSCPDSAPGIFDKLLLTPNIKYCLREEHASLEKYTSDESLPANADCSWQLIYMDYQLKSSLQASIPHGDSKSLPPVLWATIIASWVISLWTVYRSLAVPLRINHKLEEQRHLQKKNK